MRRISVKCKRTPKAVTAILAMCVTIFCSAQASANQNECDAFFSELNDFLEITYLFDRVATNIEAVIASCEKNYEEATTEADAVRLGMAYVFGGQFPEAQTMLQPYAQIQTKAGVFYALSFVASDLDQYVKILTEIADDGDAQALLLLGMLHESGAPEYRRPDLSAGYFKQSAEAGNSNGMFYYGREFGIGGFFGFDPPTMLAWMEKAVSAGHGGAAYFLAIEYLYGNYVERDCDKVNQLLELSHTQGFEPPPLSAGLMTMQFEKLCPM